MSLTSKQKEDLLKSHPEISEENIDHFYSIIHGFMKLFGDDEYINFHNNYLLPLFKKKFHSH